MKIQPFKFLNGQKLEIPTEFFYKKKKWVFQKLLINCQEKQVLVYETDLFTLSGWRILGSSKVLNIEQEV